MIYFYKSVKLIGVIQTNQLCKYYKERKIPVQDVEFDFHVPTKPIVGLTHLIYQQEILQSLINQVYDFITTGVISQEEGEPLIAIATNIINPLSG